MPKFTAIFDPRPPNRLIVHGIRNATIYTPQDVPYQITMARIECTGAMRQQLLDHNVTYWDNTLGVMALPAWLRRQRPGKPWKVWHEWQGHPLQEEPFPDGFPEEE